MNKLTITLCLVVLLFANFFKISSANDETEKYNPILMVHHNEQQKKQVTTNDFQFTTHGKSRSLASVEFQENLRALGHVLQSVKSVEELKHDEEEYRSPRSLKSAESHENNFRLRRYVKKEAASHQASFENINSEELPRPGRFLRSVKSVEELKHDEEEYRSPSSLKSAESHENNFRLRRYVKKEAASHQASFENINSEELPRPGRFLRSLKSAEELFSHEVGYRSPRSLKSAESHENHLRSRRYTKKDAASQQASFENINSEKLSRSGRIY